MHSLWKSLALILMFFEWTAVARAVPVTLLPPVSPSDVVCGGVLDEDAMLRAARQWITACNDELSAIGQKDEAGVIRSLLDLSGQKLTALRKSEIRSSMETIAEAVLERWNRAGGRTETLSHSDQKALIILSRFGFVPVREEGEAYLRLNPAFFYKRVQLSPEGRAFADVLISQPLSRDEFMGEDGTVFQSQTERAAWAVGMERFLKDNAGSPYKADALKRYHAIMHLLLYSDVPPRRQDGSMDNWSWWRDEMMKDIVWRYRGTLTGTLTEDFIAGVDASGGKEPKDLEKHQSARIDSTFAQGGTAPQKSRNAAALQYQGEGAINGTIPVSLWFESRDGIISGEIVYTRTKDRTPIRILGRVQDNGLLRLREMLPDGRVSGTITGSLVKDTLSGTWEGRPKIIEKDGGGAEFRKGKTYPIKISRSTGTHAPFQWEANPDKASGIYAYSLGDKCDYGSVFLKVNGDGTVRYSIAALTGAPHYRTDAFPEDALSGETATAGLDGNTVLIDVDEKCAIRLTLYSDFLESKYVPGRECQYNVGNGATAEGLFLKKR